MKQYMTFSCDQYEPVGGMGDFRGDFDSLEDAVSHLRSLNCPDGTYLSIWDIELNKEAWGERTSVEWIPSGNQHIDALTKPVPFPKMDGQRVVTWKRLKPYASETL